MRIGLGLSIPELATRSGLFSPASLFTGGVVGAWYDPSEISTLFQDSAGTTPVTAVEQPVGLMLDKSQSLSGFGTQLVVNGDFSTGDLTNWSSNGGGSFAISSNRLQITGAAATNTGASYQLSTVVGTMYSVSFAVIMGTATTIDSQMSLLASGGSSIGASYQFINSANTYTYNFIATATTTYFQVAPRGVGNTVFIDNVSVKSLGVGNHASQATTASRPVLRARYNLLTYSEQFDNAAWTKSSSSISQNSTTAPDGTTTADTLIEDNTLNSHRAQQAVTTSGGGTHTASIYVKASTRSWFALYVSGANVGRYFNVGSGAIGSALVAAPTTSTIDAVGSGWYRCAITFTATASSTLQIYLATGDGVNNYTGDGTSGLYVWGADLRYGSSAGTYQRIAAATDYNTTGFLPYLAFDGTDDSMATGSINFSATDKMSVFAGVTKLSDAATGAVASTNSSGSPGYFEFFAPSNTSANDFAFRSFGTLSSQATSAGSFASPYTAVATGFGNISGDSSVLRLNGTQVASNSTDQGTGNYGNYPLFIGRRGGTSLPYNGRIYSLIVAGKLASATEIASTEAWVNGKTGAY